MVVKKILSKSLGCSVIVLANSTHNSYSSALKNDREMADKTSIGALLIGEFSERSCAFIAA